MFRKYLWLDILKVVKFLKSKCIYLLSYCIKKVENSEGTLFWEDTWTGDPSLKCKFPRLYALGMCKQISIVGKLRYGSIISSFRRVPREGIEAEQYDEMGRRITLIQLAQMKDRWVWSPTSNGYFSVKPVHNLMDESLLSSDMLPTRWVKDILIKINVFAWKVQNGYLQYNALRRLLVSWVRSSKKYFNDTFEYRHVVLPPKVNTHGEEEDGESVKIRSFRCDIIRLSSGELDLLFEAMYDDYVGGQPSATKRTVPAAQEPQVRQTSTASTSIADSAPTPTNSSSLATNVPNTSQDVDELNLQQQHAQQQGIQAHLQFENVADNVSNAMFDGNTFVNPFATPSTSAAESSSSQNVDP
nr:hypothetical protein [Tanacetum cinerariifolium]